MGANEHTKDITYSSIKDGLRFSFDTAPYPGLHYDLLIPGRSFAISDDRIFFADGLAFDKAFLTLSLKQEASFTMLIKGRLCGCREEDDMQPHYEFEAEKQKVRNYYQNLIRHFHLDEEAKSEQTAILNETIWWYAHNAMIHYAMPHGLEQPGGAAWGTRDICQGPVEFFLAGQHYGLVRQILMNLFSHQDIHTGEWPQWFMFDRYTMNSGECHGDIIFWPLKCIADYLYATGDISILEEEIPYVSPEEVPKQKGTLLSHIALALSNIKETRMINSTGLITYAGGDWDDTLQPASDYLKEHLVSAWTVALAYQTFSGLAETLSEAAPEMAFKFHGLADLVNKAFRNFLIKDGVIAGFLECGDEYSFLLHPSDNKTGIHYRLLPLTRSIIAELVSPAQAAENAETIHAHLACPDGIRLMDRPAKYSGGVSHLFKRAEQAASIGREISLQYTHAHIRYIEAMAKLGNGEEAWNSLFLVNPILIRHYVPNARIRQSNLYFSSSDGAYPDRYDYAEHYRLLWSGEIEVKGGWRLYSSGPGIYISQLVSNILGIRFCRDGLILDPVLPKSMDRTVFTYDCFGRTLHFTYHMIEPQAEQGRLSAGSEGKALPFLDLPNPYRQGGILIRRETLDICSDSIDIYCAAT